MKTPESASIAFFKTAFLVSEAIERRKAEKFAAQDPIMQILTMIKTEIYREIVKPNHPRKNYDILLGSLDALEQIMSANVNFATADEETLVVEHSRDLLEAIQEAKTVVEGIEAEGPKTYLRTQIANIFLARVSPKYFRPDVS